MLRIKRESMNLRLLIILIAIFTCGCKKDVQHTIPDCIQEKVIIHSSSDVCDEPGNVALWIFHDEFVYVFYQGDCLIDASAQVYNESCELIGSIGGWLGNELNGDDFYQIGEFQKYIYP